MALNRLGSVQARSIFPWSLLLHSFISHCFPELVYLDFSLLNFLIFIATSLPQHQASPGTIQCVRYEVFMKYLQGTKRARQAKQQLVTQKLGVESSGVHRKARKHLGQRQGRYLCTQSGRGVQTRDGRVTGHSVAKTQGAWDTTWQKDHKCRC